MYCPCTLLTPLSGSLSTNLSMRPADSGSLSRASRPLSETQGAPVSWGSEGWSFLCNGGPHAGKFSTWLTRSQHQVDTTARVNVYRILLTTSMNSLLKCNPFLNKTQLNKTRWIYWSIIMIHHTSLVIVFTPKTFVFNLHWSFFSFTVLSVQTGAFQLCRSSHSSLTVIDRCLQSHWKGRHETYVSPTLLSRQPSHGSFVAEVEVAGAARSLSEHQEEENSLSHTETQIYWNNPQTLLTVPPHSLTPCQYVSCHQLTRLPVCQAAFPYPHPSDRWLSLGAPYWES